VHIDSDQIAFNISIFQSGARGRIHGFIFMLKMELVNQIMESAWENDELRDTE